MVVMSVVLVFVLELLFPGTLPVASAGAGGYKIKIRAGIVF